MKKPPIPARKPTVPQSAKNAAMKDRQDAMDAKDGGAFFKRMEKLEKADEAVMKNKKGYKCGGKVTKKGK